MQLYHDALLLRQHLRFVHDRRCNFIMTPFSIYFAFIYYLLRDHVISTNLLLVIFIYRTMVYFTERCLSGVRHLVVLSDRNQPREDGLDCAELKIKIDCVALKKIIVCAALKMMIA